MQYTLEVIPLPVSDIDRARDFYRDKVGFHVDIDQEVMPGMRIVQLFRRERAGTPTSPPQRPAGCRPRRSSGRSSKRCASRLARFPTACLQPVRRA